MEEQPITFTAFAKMIGISQSAVSQHVKRGVISKKSLLKRGKRTFILAKRAMQDLEGSLDPLLKKWKRPEPEEFKFWDILDEAETVERTNLAINDLAYLCHCLTDPQMKSEIANALDTIVNVLNGE